MRIKILLISLMCLLLTVIVHNGFSDDDTYYARCNLKVIKGNYITWVNWQSTNTVVPVNTALRVSRGGKKATLVDIESGKSYILDLGNDGDAYLEKFVTKDKVNIEKFPEDIQRNIEKTTAVVGMTREQVYISMGPPAWAGQKTHVMTYKEIMAEDLWTYKRRRFGKNIGVAFNHKTGKVDRTEGIWGK